MLSCQISARVSRMFGTGQLHRTRVWAAPFAFWLRLGFCFAAAGVCAGCFQPLYGEGLVAGRPDIRDSLAAIDVKQIEAAANTPEARLAVQIRNDLLFN